MIWLLVACGGGDSGEKLQKDLSGEELVEAYNTAICDLYEQDDCTQVMASCGDAVPNYSDWAQCMNEQSDFTDCSNIPVLFYEEYETASECIELLTTAACASEDLCMEGGNLLQTGPCGSLAGLVFDNCGPFGF